ncbi:MAG: type IX secretion system protein PorQ [Dysgonamonadaceae bacterium]|nr:type IX secretion system protein PorQ [Dysgonamonadaceae bacterium]
MLRTLYSCLFLSFGLLVASAQESNVVFQFLKFPYSARASALGGSNVSIIENDISLIYQNPAFLGTEMDKSLNVNYMFYVADIGIGNATYTKAIGERNCWGIGVNYVNYGNMQETTEQDVIVGDLAIKDIGTNIFYAHDLTEKLRGGVNAKFVYSLYDEYTSIGIGVDLGLSYFDQENNFSMGLVGKHLGRQVKAYDEEYLNMPWEIQFGISKKLAHAPIRFSVTAVDLNRWNYFDMVTGEKKSFSNTFVQHLIFGVDFIPTENLWIAVGYNARTASDMSLEQGNKMGGFSIGAGLNLKSIKISCAMAKYHPSASSFIVGLTTSFSEVKL